MGRIASKVAVAPLGVLTRRRPGDIVILLYHRIGDGPGEIELRAEEFAVQMAYLSERENVLSLDTLLDGSTGGGVIVTFDDGTSDFHEFVLPILVGMRVPATLYLATSLVREEGGDGLTWRQLEDARDTGLVTIGSHTHSHADLSKLDERSSEDEMSRSKGLIEDRLGVECRHFAYPWSVASPAADRAARRIFRTAALESWRTNRTGRVDLFRLGRTPVLASDGQTFFRGKVHGFLDGEALVYRALRRGPWRATFG
jgi:peptidoglycan/xylan/chitin deacetylase (PgdA/CDA1 family)